MFIFNDRQIFELLAIFMMVMVRTSTFFLVSPVFSMMAVNIRVRIVFASVITIMLLGNEDIRSFPVALDFSTLLVVFWEVVLATAMGFLIRIIFSALSIAGEQISSLMGLSFANVVDPQTGGGTPVISQVMNVFLTLVFLSLDGHTMLITMLSDSYRILPIGSFSISYNSLRNIGLAGSYIFISAAIIAMPICLVLFITNLVIGVLTRLSPQMNIFSVGFPFSILLGLIIMIFSIGGIETYMREIVLFSFELCRDLVIYDGNWLN